MRTEALQTTRCAPPDGRVIVCALRGPDTERRQRFPCARPARCGRPTRRGQHGARLLLLLQPQISR
jgi:hypothetical protein